MKKRKRKPKQHRNARGQFACAEPPYLGEFRPFRGEPGDRRDAVARQEHGVTPQPPRSLARRLLDFFRGIP